MRLAGGVLMVIICYLIGCRQAREQKVVCDNLRGVIRLLDSIENGITYGGESLLSIVSRFEDDALCRCGYLDALRRGRASGFAESLHLLNLPNDVKREIEPFASHLGLLCAEMQVSELRRTRDALQKSYDELCQRLLQKQKVTRAVWGLGGALVALFLI